ncbi:MAG TPA: RNA polymerase sigma factor SigI [Symbiobacteriaceae bacterium]|nr:RNA polymerase sigma factor SigI [Symbiobacteriaceae bacterium]
MLGFLLSLSGNSQPPDTSAVDKLLEAARRGDKQAREDLIRQFTPLALRVGSQVSGRYLQVGRDEEVSIGLLGLNEAIDRFDAERGASFVSFAEMVIKRRLIDFYRRQKGRNEIPLSELESEDDEGNVLQSAERKQAVAVFEKQQEAEDRKHEIIRYSKRLAEYGIRFGELVEICPKHEDARERALEAARLVARTPLFAQHMQAKKELPLKQLEERVGVSRKTLERQRKYIIAVALIMLEDFYHLRQYIAG